MSGSGYQNVRETLIALEVDLDDKKKICEHLKGKIAQERAKLSTVEADLSTDYEAVMDEEMSEAQRELERLRSLSSTLINEKKELVKLCQVLVDSIREEERDIAAEGRRLNRESLEALDLEKKTFRARHPERLQKFLASKAQQEKETTGKALQPEFTRLQQMHEREVAEAEARAGVEERRMREDCQDQLEELVRDEREAHSERQKSVQRNRHTAVSTELEAGEREHRMRMVTAQSDAEKDLSKVKQQLATRVEKERREGQAEVLAAQENFQKRVHELRTRHMADIAALMKDHDEQTRNVRLLAQRSREEAEKLINQERHEGGDEGGDGVEGDADVFTEKMREEAHMDRDRRLQSEIRSLQAESVRLERAWKARAAEEKQYVVDSRDKEAKESARRQRQLNEESAELMAQREQLAQDARRAQETLTTTTSELQEARREIDVYEGGIAAHRARMRDMETLSSSRLRDDESSNHARVEAVRARVERMKSQIEAKQRSSERELADMEAHHVKEMESLDKQVKAEVVRKDEDLDLLRDAVHSEKVKIARLEKLVKGQRSLT
jgi:hypothetical protein